MRATAFCESIKLAYTPENYVIYTVTLSRVEFLSYKLQASLQIWRCVRRAPFFLHKSKPLQWNETANRVTNCTRASVERQNR